MGNGQDEQIAFSFLKVPSDWMSRMVETTKDGK